MKLYLSRWLLLTWTITFMLAVVTFILLKQYIDNYKTFVNIRPYYGNQSISSKSDWKTREEVNIKKRHYHLLHKITDRKRKKQTKHAKSSDVKYIHYYNNPEFIHPNVFDKCEYTCKMNSRSFDNSDVVIFFGSRLSENVKPPQKRQGQIWVYHSKESPANFKDDLEKWKNLFNWTMTFRRDSDILAINGIFAMRKTSPNYLQKSTFSTKTKSTAWFVSRCKSKSQRELFVNLLKKRQQSVDIFGKCGTLKCPRQNENMCMDILRTNYKFYLSFENSLCYDYITEKSYKIYSNLIDVIPVVRGVGDQYSIFLPPNSFINTDNFQSVSGLLKFMNNVETNETLFKSFFKWKPFYESYWPFPVEFCELCRRAHHADDYRNLYVDLDKWITLKNYKQTCRIPADVV